MHNYTRILRLLIISKYYYDATEESVRGNFIKNGLALWKKGCTEKIESINNNLYPGVKIIKPTLKTRMDDIRFNGLTGKKRVQNAGKTSLSQPIFTEDGLEERPLSKKEDNSTKKGRKKARNAGKTSLSQPIFTEDGLEERPLKQKEDNFTKKGRKREKMLVMTRKKKNDIKKSPTKVGLKMTRSSKNDLQIDEDISFAF
ncbi:hypothetical protein M0812_01293 [Anaeramoeba flamelloides]|uniref:Uncharacterized protein n=1 Tax=Anaeramoeba flamelloides TaxID=1746091 RepID=A0AAV8A3D8_9EUKA|nr:hypothetical protein M0812_01293 [Anaeramoeba flamelloides]